MGCDDDFFDVTRMSLGPAVCPRWASVDATTSGPLIPEPPAFPLGLGCRRTGSTGRSESDAAWWSTLQHAIACSREVFLLGRGRELPDGR